MEFTSKLERIVSKTLLAMPLRRDTTPYTQCQSKAKMNELPRALGLADYDYSFFAKYPPPTSTDPLAAG